jgi:hypothetical protein
MTRKATNRNKAARKTSTRKGKKPAPKKSAGSPFDRVKRDGVDSYETKAKAGGHTISIRFFFAESQEELDVLIRTAKKFWRSRTKWFKAYREFAATELLEMLNGVLDCGEDDPPVVTADQLRKILKLPFSVTFFGRDDDSSEVSFQISGGEDDALQENVIDVSGTLESGLTDGDVYSLL